MNQSGPTPERIFDTLNAFQRTAALKAALDLELFTAVAAGANTASTLAPKLGVSERGLRILCDYLTVVGFLEKTDNTYALAPDAALFLDRASPAYMGTAAQFLNNPAFISAFGDVVTTVRQGGTILPGQGSVEPENPMWVDFARGMASLVRPAAEFIASLVGPTGRDGGRLRVLDIAAGHGLFGINIAQRHPQAEVYALDWPRVLEVAEENARAAGVSERFHQLPGNAFERDLGSDYDLVLLTNFFHHFDQPTCVSLMKRVHAALADGGRAVTLDFVPNDDRVSPPAPAAFSFIMLNTTRSGDAYTLPEFDQMFRQAGFSRSELHVPPGLPESVIVSYR